MACDTDLPHRVAIYFAPSTDSSWWSAGCAWLGRCAHTGLSVQHPQVEGWGPEAWARLTAEPRRYGWHATLKAPFQLAPGLSLADVRAAVRHVCACHSAFDLAPLQVVRMGHFMALRPSEPQPELDPLAGDCVRQLQPLAAPLTAEPLARRRQASLTPEQDALLQAWGYPYVFEQFRFHFSLTGPLHSVSQDQQSALWDAAIRYFHGLPVCRVESLSIFVEPTPGADFRLVEQIGLAP